MARVARIVVPFRVGVSRRDKPGCSGIMSLRSHRLLHLALNIHYEGDRDSLVMIGYYGTIESANPATRDVEISILTRHGQANAAVMHNGCIPVAQRLNQFPHVGSYA